MCQPTISAVYRTPALLEIVPILVLVKVSAVLYDFADTMAAKGTIRPALCGEPHYSAVPGI